MRNQASIETCRRTHSSHKRSHSKGFTLIELLVVVLVIAVLAALLLPALSKAKSRVQTIACLNNLKQLEISCHLYTSDFADFLPPNQPVKTGSQPGNTNALVSFFNASSWCPGIAPTDMTVSDIQQGLIFPYNRSPAIYHCPADLSTVNGFPSQPRTRSYSMDVAINSTAATATYQKYTDIKLQPPSELFVFIDSQEQSIWDGTFDMYSLDSYWSDYWLELAADRHTQGADLSFADGHVEYWRWKARKVYDGYFVPAYSQADLADLHRLQEYTKPDVN